MRLLLSSPWLLLAALLIALPVRAENAVTLNLKDADINTLIETVSDVTGRNFIVDPRVKAKVTVVSASPMPPAAVYETFLSILQVYGFAAIPSGNAIKIVPENNARQEAGTTGLQRSAPPDEIVTRVMEIKNVPAAQLVPILRPLVPQWGHLAAYSPSNMLIISDRAGNMRRLESIINDVDRSGENEIELVRLRHASASEVVRILQSLSKGENAQNQGQQTSTLIADERSNSVLIGGEKTERQRYIDIVRELDVELDEDGSTQVVYLRHASAEDLAPILQGYAEQAADQQSGSNQQASGSGSGRRGAIADGSSVIAEPDTNSLLITAPPKAMRALRSVIEKLDIKRAQVMVETLIAEISSSKQAELGLDWAVFNEDRVAAAGIFDPDTGQLLSSLGGATSGSSNLNASALTGLLGQGITLGGGRIRDGGTSFAILLKALQGDGDTNILSAPTLLTMDNEEAEFSVGQEVPFLTGQFTNTGANNGSVNPFQTIERRDVGLTLNVTPQINEGDHIQLELSLEVSSLGAGGSSLQQITNSRSITNTVSVEDGQVLILGGLIDDNVTDSRSGVPFLSKIPLIGALFRFQSVQSEKRNLMLFMRPRILRDRATSDFYTQQKYEQTQRALNANERDVPILDRAYPRLEDFELFLDDGSAPGRPLSSTVGDQLPAPTSRR
ncbi:MAG: type II secretion system secretin GspD [Algiphilus sp.]|uniref:type II secretion system secretin GspD n=1 Tax=Algiphilus sp. TaxID=1872431 RepID=UPI001CA70563|nr:type II secretion system secretin GspD [Algiphilus sp.]MBY8966406.1 type II secretion system secretin GspD [Algiphilus acroporae]MCI5061400.1 type II secretion system secretin GspD [Algiphilus sp.]MCI5103249.1 type II secretion system secretin GspD [Algiphilus sp.]